MTAPIQEIHRAEEGSDGLRKKENFYSNGLGRIR
jgi:hypothetical protein